MTDELRAMVALNSIDWLDAALDKIPRLNDLLRILTPEDMALIKRVWKESPRWEEVSRFMWQARPQLHGLIVGGDMLDGLHLCQIATAYFDQVWWV